MTSQAVKAALSRLARFEAQRVYSYASYRIVDGELKVIKRAGVYKVGK